MTELDREVLLRAHAPTLHRVALMLTGDPERADDAVVGAALSLPEGTPASVDDVLTRLVREHGRRRLGGGRDRLRLTTGAGADPGEALDALDARTRAAVVLHLGAGWTAERAARAARVRPGQLARALAVPDLDRAVAALADRDDRSEPELVLQLLDRLPSTSPVGRPEKAAAFGTTEDVAGGGGRSTETAYGRGRGSVRRRAVAALTTILVVGGTVVALGGGERPTPVLPPPDGPSLAERGWVLDPDGDPPSSVDGMILLGTAEVDQANRYSPVRVPASRGTGSAVWAVLWCDLVAPDDPHVTVPVVTMEAQGTEVSLRCAGTDGVPAVEQLVHLPGRGATLSPTAWTGDLPAEGEATLAFYAERETLSHVDGLQTAPVPGPTEVAVTHEDGRTAIWDGEVRTDLIEVGPGAEVTLWAGTSLALRVLVDGIPLTDDGDPGPWEQPRGGVGWKEQDPELRQGFWWVATGDRTRTFALPEEVRPAAGERRTVALTTVTPEDTTARWQARVSDAARAHVELFEVPLRPGRGGLEPGRAPDEVGGYRLAGTWEVPADGMVRTLQIAAEDVALLRAFMLADDQFVSWQGQADAVAVLESSRGLLMLGPHVTRVTDAWWSQSTPWSDGPPARGLEDGAVQARLPAKPGHPTRTVLAYLPVAYDDFDFDTAPLTASTWPAGTASPYGTPSEGGPRRLADLLRDADDRPTFEVPHDGGMLEVTTRGRGRMRVLVDGRPWTDLAPAHDGWWSSWTSRHVTSVVELWNLPPGATAVLEVEGWEEGFSAHLLAW